MGAKYDNQVTFLSRPSQHALRTEKQSEVLKDSYQKQGRSQKCENEGAGLEDASRPVGSRGGMSGEEAHRTREIVEFTTQA